MQQLMEQRNNSPWKPGYLKDRILLCSQASFSLSWSAVAEPIMIMAGEVEEENVSGQQCSLCGSRPPWSCCHVPRGEAGTREGRSRCSSDGVSRKRVHKQERFPEMSWRVTERSQVPGLADFLLWHSFHPGSACPLCSVIWIKYGLPKGAQHERKPILFVPMLVFLSDFPWGWQQIFIHTGQGTRRDQRNDSTRAKFDEPVYWRYLQEHVQGLIYRSRGEPGSCSNSKPTIAGVTTHKIHNSGVPKSLLSARKCLLPRWL